MPASTPVTKARERIKSILDAVSGFTAARVKLGNVNLAADNTFLTTLITSGPYVTVGRAKFKDGTISSAAFYAFDVEVNFWFGFADDADETFVALEDVFVGALSALMAKSSWTGTDYGMFPTGYDLDDITEDSGKPRKLHYAITMHFGRSE